MNKLEVGYGLFVLCLVGFMGWLIYISGSSDTATKTVFARACQEHGGIASITGDLRTSNSTNPGYWVACRYDGIVQYVRP